MQLLPRAKRWASRISARAILVATWLLLLAYAYPGYMNYDAGEQLFEARSGVYRDWHPPLMAAYWHVFDAIVRGPLLMLVLQTLVFIAGLYAIISPWLVPRAAAIATALLVIYPPIMTTIAVVWKDAQMAAFLLCGLVLATREGRPRRAVGLVLLLLAVGVRDNAILAIPPLALLIMHTWGIRRLARRLAIAIGLCLALFIGATAVNRTLSVVHDYPWYRSVAIHDIAGTLCNERPMTDDEIRGELPGVELLVKNDLQANFCKQYDPRTFFPLVFGSNDIFKSLPNKADRVARRKAWKRIVANHTGPWLAHRWAVMQEVLGLNSKPLWEPVCQTFQPNLDHIPDLQYDTSAPSWFQSKVGALFVALGGTALFRPWVYAVLALILLPYAIRIREWWVAALLASGLCYEAGYFLAASGPDYRYSHWMVLCTCIAIVALFIRRLRDARSAA